MVCMAFTLGTGEELGSMWPLYDAVQHVGGLSIVYEGQMHVSCWCWHPIGTKKKDLCGRVIIAKEVTFGEVQAKQIMRARWKTEERSARASRTSGWREHRVRR